MPVGNADKGVGLGAGEIMFTGDYIYQAIDWEHSPIGNEQFDHYGHLNSNIFNLGFTIGLNDYWNVSISQLLIERCMDWEPHQVSTHHRTECTSTDFDNANGGYLGDTTVNFRYLLQNQGKGPGNRIFLGTGFIHPSNNMLTGSPFLSEDGDYPDHRHFALSDGTYKILTDFQFFKKRLKMPVFWGVTFSTINPIEESKFGFSPSKVYDLSLMALTGPVDIKTNFLMISSIGLNYSFRYTSNAKWNGIIAPNSKSKTHIPGVSILFGSEIGTFGINLQKAYMDNLSTNDDVLYQDAEVWQFSVSYRKLLDKYIDRLYWK